MFALGSMRDARAQAPAPSTAQPSAQTSAETLGTILLVRTEGDERVIAFIRAELRATAWRAIEIGPDARIEQSRLADLAASQSVTAALRVHPERSQVELWVARPSQAGGTLETIDAQGSHDEQVLALRATEALRARGLKLERVEQTPTAAPVEKPQPAPQPAAEARQKPAEPAHADATPRAKPATQAARVAEPPAASRTEQETHERESEPEEEEEEEEEPAPPLIPTRLALELAPSLALSPGGLGPAFDAWLGLRWRIARLFSISGLGVVPIWSDRIDRTEGSAKISTLILGAAADLELEHRRWQFRVGAGAGGLISVMSGSKPEAPLRAVTDTVTTSALFGRSSIRIALGSGWGLYLAALVGASVPKLSVQFRTHVGTTFGRDTVAHWGQPFVLGSLGIELPLLLGNP